MKFGRYPSFPALVELVTPYIEFAVAEIKRHVELGQHVEKIRADAVTNTLRSLPIRFSLQE